MAQLLDRFADDAVLDRSTDDLREAVMALEESIQGLDRSKQIEILQLMTSQIVEAVRQAKADALRGHPH